MKFQTGTKENEVRGRKGKGTDVCEKVGMNQSGLQTGMHYTCVYVFYFHSYEVQNVYVETIQIGHV